MGRVDVCLLPFFGASAKQDDQPLPILAKLNPISRPKIQPQFRNPGTCTFCHREVTLLQAQDGGDDSGAGGRVELHDPIPVRNPALSIDIFTDFNHKEW